MRIRSWCASRKIRYVDFAEAHVAAAAHAARGDEKAIYYHRACRGWHLTTKRRRRPRN
jgi:hypothetical protein